MAGDPGFVSCVVARGEVAVGREASATRPRTAAVPQAPQHLGCGADRRGESPRPGSEDLLELRVTHGHCVGHPRPVGKDALELAIGALELLPKHLNACALAVRLSLSLGNHRPGQA